MAAAAPADAADRSVDSDFGLDMSGANDCADSAFTVTGTTWAEFIDLTVRGDEYGIIASTPVFVEGNVFDDPDAIVMVAVLLLPGADGSIINSNDVVDPFPSYARMRGGVSSIADEVVIANNSMSGLNFGISAGSSDGDPSVILGNVIEGIHDWPVQGIGISAIYSAVSGNRITNAMGPDVNGIQVARDVTTNGNFISGQFRGVVARSNLVNVRLSNDVIVANSHGVEIFDTLPALPQTDAALTNLTVWDNVIDLWVEGAAVSIDSSIFGSVSSNAGATCAISFSRADRITANPNACGAFTTTEPPRFVDPASDNFQLRQASTLVDAGNPDSPPMNTLAFNGLPRALPGNCEPAGDAIRDMGAYELDPDCDPPNTKFTRTPKRKVKSKKVTFKIASNDQDATFECRLDKRAWKPCAATVKFRVKPGKHTFRARAVDEAGNADPTPATFKFKRTKKKRKQPTR